MLYFGVIIKLRKHLQTARVTSMPSPNCQHSLYDVVSHSVPSVHGWSNSDIIFRCSLSKEKDPDAKSYMRVFHAQATYIRICFLSNSDAKLTKFPSRVGREFSQKVRYLVMSPLAQEHESSKSSTTTRKRQSSTSFSFPLYAHSFNSFGFIKNAQIWNTLEMLKTFSVFLGIVCYLSFCLKTFGRSAKSILHCTIQKPQGNDSTTKIPQRYTREIFTPIMECWALSLLYLKTCTHKAKICARQNYKCVCAFAHTHRAHI